jgi:hypothetical protein
VISRDEMPDDNAELATLDVTFPELEENTTASCPVPIRDVVEYLRMESPDGDAVQESSLQFLRTALVSDHRYWIWSFEESDGSACFVTVSASPNGETCTGYEENHYSLTPEQFMLGDFHQVF